ncbi:MAG: DUF4118 domain-containing protein [Vicinamibacteraceae bacterium]|nr:DUF4118 domain-containing protein [Vicinamibacteraceae bacterium]
MRARVRRDVVRLAFALAAVGAVTLFCARVLHVSTATISIAYLLIVLLAAADAGLWVAIVTSVVAMLCFNFFFLPPVGTWTIADPHNWVALVALLVVSLVASHLSAVARARTAEALERRDALARLFDLGRDVLVMADSPDALSGLARSVARRFGFDLVAIALPAPTGWQVSHGGRTAGTLDPRRLTEVFAAAQSTLEFDAQSRTYTGHDTMDVDGRPAQLVPLRVGTRPIGLLAVAGRPVERGTLDTLAGLVALAIERARFLEERKMAEVTRRSEALKTALLASLGHDLRTPLTAIRLAATNVTAVSLTPDERQEQGDVILAELEHLTRLFENLLEMARIDAGGVTTEVRWAHPSEIVDAAREQVEQALRGHPVTVTLGPDLPVHLDPRLTATALARLLENAAHYSPPDSIIEVQADASEGRLVVQVRDHGPGISSPDLPHVFERFYRGGAAGSRRSGTGMGLWIARGLLAVQHGRIWAENADGGGARFTLDVPAPVKEPAVSSS